MNKRNVKYMCLAGILTAVVFVFTAYLHIPTHTGYAHIGDGFIFIAACLLPAPYAAFVGAGGALLADCLTGYALWAPGSVIIKTLTVFLFTSKTERIIARRNIIACPLSVILCVGGYYLYEGIITGNFVSPVGGIPGNITQSVLSSVLFIILGLALDKADVKNKINA